MCKIIHLKSCNHIQPQYLLGKKGWETRKNIEKRQQKTWLFKLLLPSKVHSFAFHLSMHPSSMTGFLFSTQSLMNKSLSQSHGSLTNWKKHFGQLWDFFVQKKLSIVVDMLKETQILVEQSIILVLTITKDPLFFMIRKYMAPFGHS